MDEPLTQFDDIKVPMLQLPELSRFQTMQTVLLFDFHIIHKDTQPRVLLQKNGLHLCNAPPVLTRSLVSELVVFPERNSLRTVETLG